MGDESIKYSTTKIYEKSSRCLDLFNNIPLDPYGEVFACCGLMSARLKIMRIGNVNRNKIKNIFESSFDDLLKIWLYTGGPFEILQYIAELKGEEMLKSCKHKCDYCRDIFKDFDNIRLLRKHVKDYSAGVLLNYSIIYKENSYE